MKNPVFVVVHVIDSGDSGQLLCNAIFGDEIGHDIAGQSRIGETVGIGIIQLAELAAAVANIH